MKKKLLSLILVVAVATGLVACGASSSSSPSSAPEDQAYEDSVAILSAVWNQYTDAFPVMGGSFENPVDNGPGAVKTDDTDTMTNTLLVPSDVQGSVSEIASLVHMMNANTFTAVAMRVDGMSSADVAAKVKDTFLNNQFVCGMPDKIAIAQVDGYIVYAYGEAGIIDEFKEYAEQLENVVAVEEYNY